MYAYFFSLFLFSGGVLHEKYQETGKECNDCRRSGFFPRAPFIFVLETHNNIVSHLLLIRLIASYIIIISVNAQSGLGRILTAKAYGLLRMADLPYIGPAPYCLEFYGNGKEAGCFISIQRYIPGKDRFSQFIRYCEIYYLPGEVFHGIYTDFLQIAAVRYEYLLNSGILSNDLRGSCRSLIPCNLAGTVKYSQRACEQYQNCGIT